MLIELLHCQYYDKEVLNSNGHQFYIYQQNEQSSLILIELTEHKKKTRNMLLEIQVPGLGQAQTIGGVKPFNVNL
jgi:hypothetical protein